MKVTTTEIQGIMLEFYRSKNIMPNTLLMPATQSIEWIGISENPSFSRRQIELYFGLNIVFAAVPGPQVCIR